MATGDIIPGVDLSGLNVTSSGATTPPPAPKPMMVPNYAQMMNKVVAAAPTLHPELAHAAVVAGGDPVDNAHKLAALDLMHRTATQAIQDHTDTMEWHLRQEADRYKTLDATRAKMRGEQYAGQDGTPFSSIRLSNLPTQDQIDVTNLAKTAFSNPIATGMVSSGMGPDYRKMSLDTITAKANEFKSKGNLEAYNKLMQLAQYADQVPSDLKWYHDLYDKIKGTYGPESPGVLQLVNQRIAKIKEQHAQAAMLSENFELSGKTRQKTWSQEQQAAYIRAHQNDPMSEVPPPTIHVMHDEYNTLKNAIIEKFVTDPSARSLYENPNVDFFNYSGLSTEAQKELKQLQDAFRPYFAGQLEGWSSQTTDPSSNFSSPFDGIVRGLVGNVKKNVATLPKQASNSAAGPVPQTMLPYPTVGLVNPLNSIAGMVLPGAEYGASAVMNNTQNQFRLLLQAYKNNDWVTVSRIVAVWAGTALTAVALQRILGGLGAEIGAEAGAGLADVLGEGGAASAGAGAKEAAFASDPEIVAAREAARAGQARLIGPTDAAAQNALETLGKVFPKAAAAARDTTSTVGGMSEADIAAAAKQIPFDSAKYLASEHDVASELDHLASTSLMEGTTQTARSFSVETVRSAADAVSKAVRSAYNQVDKAVLHGLKTGELDLESMKETARAALDKALLTVKQTAEMTRAEFEELTKAAQNVLDRKIEFLHDTHVDAQASGVSRAARAGAALSRNFAVRTPVRAVGWAVDNTFKALKSAPYFTWSVGTAGLDPLLFRDQWEHANGKGSPHNTIGQSIFGAGSWESGVADAFVAFTEGPSAMGAFGRAGKVAADTSAFTEAAVDRAWSGVLGPVNRYRMALKQLQGLTPAEMIRIFPFLGNDIGDGMTVASMLTGKSAAAVRDASKAAYDAELKSGGTLHSAELARQKVIDSNVGMSAKDMHQVFKELAASAEYTEAIKLPQSGIYGIIRAGGKLSENATLQYFSRLFAQSPMTLAKSGSIEARVVKYGDTGGLSAIGQLMQQGGATPAQIAGTINRMLLSPDNAYLWRSVYQGSLSNMMAMEADRVLVRMAADAEGMSIKSIFDRIAKYQKELDDFEAGKISLDPLRRQNIEKEIASWQARIGDEATRKEMARVYAAIDETAAQMAGDSSAGLDGYYGYARSDLFDTNTDLSRLVNGRHAALTFKQRGELLIPSYKEVSRAMDTILKLSIDKYAPAGMKLEHLLERNFLKGTDWVNTYMNDMIFKPLALLTGGWATRVSLSEMSLNTARLGPQDVVAGYAAQNLERQAYRIRTLMERGMGAKEARAQVDRDMEDEAFQRETLAMQQENVKRVQQAYDADTALGKAGGLRRRPADLLPSPELTQLTNSITPSAIEKRLVDAGYTAPRIAYRNVAAFVRGLIMGLDENIIIGVGREDFLKAAIDLSFRHNTYLPGVANAVHTKQMSGIDYNADEIQKTYRTNLFGPKGETKVKKFGKLKGEIKLKRIPVQDKWHGVGFNDSSYFEGWHHMLLSVSSDKIYASKVAGILRDAYDSGLSKEEARAYAINQAEIELRKLPESELRTMTRSTSPSVASAGQGINDPLRSWATDEVDNIIALVHGQGPLEEALFHKNLLDQTADGTLPKDLGSFIRENGGTVDEAGNAVKYSNNDLPFKVNARERGLQAWTHGIQHIAQIGHEKAFGPLVNHLARQPVFIAEFARQRQGLDEKVLNGLLSKDQADVIAEIAATRNMTKFIHNPIDKTKFEEMISVASPFYFAQNQAFRRMGRLLASDPGAFYQYMRMMLGTTDVVQHVVDKNGLPSVFIPLSAAMMLGLPLTASLSNLAVMDPFSPPQEGAPKSAVQTYLDMLMPRPGWSLEILGYMVLLESPFKPLGTYRERKLAEQGITIPGIGLHLGGLGAMTVNSNIRDLFIPNSILRNFVNLGLTLGGDTYTTGFLGVSSGVSARIQAMNHHSYQVAGPLWKQVQKEAKAKGWDSDQAHIEFGRRLTQLIGEKDANAKRQLQTELTWKASLALLGKAILGSVSPFSIGVGQPDNIVKTVRDQYLQKYSVKNGYNGYADAMKHLWEDHPDLYVSYVSKSQSVYGGQIPEGISMYNYINDHMEWANKYPLSFLAWGPDASSEPYSGAAAQALLDANLRILNTPEEAATALAISIGNAQYYNSAMNMGPYAAKSIKAQIAADNPEWAGALTNSKTAFRRDNLVDEMTKMINNVPELKPIKGVPLSKQSKQRQISAHLQEFLNDQYQQLLAMKSLKGAHGLTSGVVKEIWQQSIIPDAIKQYPDLKPAMNAIFYNLG